MRRTAPPLLARLGLGLILAVATNAQSAEIRGASHDWTSDGNLRVQLDLDLTPPDVLLSALANGIAVQFRTEVRLLERRFLRGERVLAAVEQTVSLEYYALSRHYVVTDLKHDRVFLGPTLGDGLELLAKRLGRISMNLDPVPPLHNPQRYELNARVVLNYQALPVPLQWDARLRGAYLTQLGWHRWPFE